MSQDQPPEQQSTTQAFIEQVLNSLVSGVLILDGKGTIVVANTAASQILMVAPEHFAGGTPWNTVTQLQFFTDILDEVQTQGKAVSRREIEVPHIEGGRVIGVTASPVQSQDKGMILLFTDLTQIRELERKAKLNTQLAQIGELTAGVVHEVRNPLSVISGMSELLMRRLDDESVQHNQAYLIHQEAAQLEKLIAQFLSFAKPFEVEKQRANPQDIVERALRLCERAAEQKSVRLGWNQKQDKFPYLPCDTKKVAQALSNILHNAIEVVDEGGHVGLSIGQDDNFFCFRVEDNGPGIEINKGESLFSPFLSKRQGGTGLGLSIVHRLITAHGGNVTYGNVDTGGAWFSIQLPMNDEEA